MQLTSSAFNDQEHIPEQYTCDGKGVPPPLEVLAVPGETKSMVLIMHDPDIPEPIREELHITEFTHWVLFNIIPTTTSINTDSGIAGVHSRGGDGYQPPCPPPEYEPSTHRYIFTVYALDCSLSVGHGATRQEVEDAMAGHIIETVQLTGLYTRKR